jgi:hypothetical protein
MMRTDSFTSSLLRSIGWRAARLYAPGLGAVKETIHRDGGVFEAMYDGWRMLALQAV